MLLRSLLVILAFSPFGFAADPPKFFELPKTNGIVPRPLPAPEVSDSTVKIDDGQWYVIPANCPLIFNQVSAGGEVSIAQLKKTTITLPLSWVIGGVPDADDPDFCTITGKALYAIKAKTSGMTTIIITPSTNRLDDTAKPVPFTDKDIGKIAFNVKPPPPAPTPPPPVVPPVTPPVTPPVVVPPIVSLTPFQLKLQAAYKLDSAPASSVAKYAALFKSAATTMVKDTTLNTGADLLKEMQVAVKGMGIPAGSMKNTAVAVETELNGFISKNGTLDQASRDNISALFARVATDLLTAGGQ